MLVFLFLSQASTKRVEFRYHDVEYVYGQTGGVTMATVVGCRQLTREGALRATIEVELRVQVSSLLIRSNMYCHCWLGVVFYSVGTSIRQAIYKSLKSLQKNFSKSISLAFFPKSLRSA